MFLMGFKIILGNDGYEEMTVVSHNTSISLGQRHIKSDLTRAFCELRIIETKPAHITSG